MTMRPALQDRLRNCITNAVAFRDMTLMRRAEQEQPPLRVAICLGPGRCLLPDAADGAPTPVVCPFCAAFPAGFASSHQVDAMAHRCIAGN